MKDRSNSAAMNRSLLAMALIAVGLIAFAGYRIATFKFFPDPPESKSFDAAEWQDPSSKDSHSDARAAMLDDLLSRYDFTGWGRTEVEAVLGVADHLNIESWSQPPDEWDFGYNAGMDWIDYRILVFDLDENDKVVAYQVELY